MKNLLNFLRSKYFVINLISAIVVVAMILGLTYKWLDSYTDHGNSVAVPDIRGMSVGAASKFLQGKYLVVQIADSSVYDLKKKPGTIIEQDPTANDKVKKGRTIYISVTRSSAPIIKMPDLKDVSLRQAEAILSSYGLTLGQQIYRPDLAKNAVLSYSNNGDELHAGDEIAKGSVIDLVIGDGIGNTTIKIPMLVDLPLEEALFVLKASSLNVGSIVYDGDIKDSLSARVFRQVPEPSDSATINQGEAIDLYVRD
ncbi:MAG TPA: PASTA domain-containing protein [Bacteroidia bacterium]|nr:PASTA domain-containing protein [Bacteroidia bacterium]HNU32609.1 PASTA domain-containing protein [Bacteroidia bacterium]